MKCLTIQNPFAHLIVTEQKLVENRKWPTRYRGPMLIHAGKGRNYLNGKDDIELAQEYGFQLPFGFIVGRVNLVQCLQINLIKTGLYDDEFPWLKNHEHTHGPWCWVLNDIERFEKPIPFNGRQGLFEIPAIELEHMGIAA